MNDDEVSGGINSQNTVDLSADYSL